MVQSKKDTSYGIIPLKKEGKQLFALAVKHSNSLFWGFPKGHANPGESSLDAAKRELKEETNLDVTQVISKTPFYEKYDFHKDEILIHKTVEFHVAYVEGDLKIDEEEVLEARWVEIEKASTLLTYDEGKKLIEAVIQSI